MQDTSHDVSDALRVQTRTYPGFPGGALIRAEGNVDVSTAPALREAVMNILTRGIDQQSGEGGGHGPEGEANGSSSLPTMLLLDLRGVGAIDSVGLGMLVNLWRLMDDTGVVASVAYLPRSYVARVLQITRLVKLLRARPIEGDASLAPAWVRDTRNRQDSPELPSSEGRT